MSNRQHSWILWLALTGACSSGKAPSGATQPTAPASGGSLAEGPPPDVMAGKPNDSAPTNPAQIAGTGNAGTATGVGVGGASTGPASAMKGTVRGTAWFRGPSCRNSAWPPVCDGPYKQTAIWLTQQSTNRTIGKAVTDDSGAFSAQLDPGWYTLAFDTGANGRWWQTKVEVRAGQTARTDLVVDTGAR